MLCFTSLQSPGQDPRLSFCPYLSLTVVVLWWETDVGDLYLPAGLVFTQYKPTGLWTGNVFMRMGAQPLVEDGEHIEGDVPIRSF